MTTISAVEARSVRVPLAAPPAMATKTVTHRNYSLVRVRCADGSYGVGFCHLAGLTPAVTTVAVREVLAPLLVGRDPLLTEQLWEEMYAGSLLLGRAGAVMRAISAVDVALWDRNARAVGLPLWRYLGGAKATRVPAYASGGYYLPDKGPAELAAEANGYLAAGFRALKIKTGRLAPAEEAERLAAVRDEVGADVRIMLDANNAWSDLPTALQTIRQLEPYDPYWIEEPFGPDDIDNHTRLAARTPVTVASGEIEAGRWRHKDWISRDAVGFLQTDALVCGGVTEFRRIAATAASFGLPVAPHAFHHVHIHLVAATPNAPYVEYFTDDTIVNFPVLVDTQLELDGVGNLLLPETPGLGFDLVHDEVDRWALDAWT